MVKDVILEWAEYSVRQSQEKQVNPYLFAFRPAGWDNEKKIAILHENFTTVKPEDAYEDFIVKPPVRKVPKSITLIGVVSRGFFVLGGGGCLFFFRAAPRAYGSSQARD